MLKEKFVIRGDKGTQFQSCDIEDAGKEATYPTEEKAQQALEQMQPYFRTEKLEIKKLN